MTAERLRILSTNILIGRLGVFGNVRSGGLRKPRDITWVTHTVDANGRVSTMLSPFFAVIVR